MTMLTLAPVRKTRAELATIDEHAAWMIVAAAEGLAARDDVAGRAAFSRIAQRLRSAVRSRWHNPGAVRTASPVVDGPDGDPVTLVESIARFHDDSRAGVREAEACLLAWGWWMEDEAEA